MMPHDRSREQTKPMNLVSSKALCDTIGAVSDAGVVFLGIATWPEVPLLGGTLLLFVDFGDGFDDSGNWRTIAELKGRAIDLEVE
jgi:hypothetical protein